MCSYAVHERTFLAARGCLARWCSTILRPSCIARIQSKADAHPRCIIHLHIHTNKYAPKTHGTRHTHTHIHSHTRTSCPGAALAAICKEVNRRMSDNEQAGSQMQAINITPHLPFAWPPFALYPSLVCVALAPFGANPCGVSQGFLQHKTHFDLLEKRHTKPQNVQVCGKPCGP